MKKIKDKIISIILFLASIVISFLAGQITQIGNYILIPSLGAMLVFLVALNIIQYIKHQKYVKYSILIFVLNESSQLLLVLSQLYGRMIVPCGMIKKNELPHLAVKRILKEEVGLNENDFVFDMRYHRKLHRYARIKDCYAPFAVQQEFITKHKHHVKYHYAFFYICNLKEGIEINGDTMYFPQFFTLDEIKDMDNDTKPFQDLVQRYEYLLKNDF